MRRARRQPKLQSLSEINIANLVDVVLVLLIVFMISAPLLQSGIEVELPQTTTAVVDFDRGLLVTLNERGAIFFSVDGQDLFINPEQFEDRIAELGERKGYLTVYLRADKDVPYGEVVRLVGRIKKAGFVSLGLVTAPYDADPGRKPGS